MRRKILLLAVAGLVAVWAVPAPAAQFKLATVAPEGSQWMTELRAGADELREKTAGRVTVKFYTGGVMGNDKKVLRKIRRTRRRRVMLIPVIQTRTPKTLANAT